jgi:hypothetical protein
MITADIHNITAMRAQTIDVTHVGQVGVLRLITAHGHAATLFVTPAQAEALAAAWEAASDKPVDDDAAVALSRQLEAEDAARDDTFAELEEMTAQPKENVYA